MDDLGPRETAFGELAFHSGLPATCGVVWVRIPWKDPITDNAFAVSTLTSRDDWPGVFASLNTIAFAFGPSQSRCPKTVRTESDHARLLPPKTRVQLLVNQTKLSFPDLVLCRVAPGQLPSSGR